MYILKNCIDFPKFLFLLGNATDCTWVYNAGERSNGIYSIKPNGSMAFNVYCEMEGGMAGYISNLLFFKKTNSYLLQSADFLIYFFIKQTCCHHSYLLRMQF